MKKLYHYLLIIFLFPTIGFSQNNLDDSNSSNQGIYKNNITLGFGILAPSVSYTRKITNNISIGAGFGFGISAYFNLKKDFDFGGGLEIADIGAVIEFKLTDNLFYELKPQLIVTANGELNSSNLIGVKNGFFIKLNKIKLGLNVTIGKTMFNRYTSDKWLFYIQPLQLKIPLQW